MYLGAWPPNRKEVTFKLSMLVALTSTLKIKIYSNGRRSNLKVPELGILIHVFMY